MQQPIEKGVKKIDIDVMPESVSNLMLHFS